MKRKILCTAAAVCVFVSGLVIPVYAQPEYYTQDFTAASTGGNGYGWLNNYQVGGMNWTTTSGWSGAFNTDKYHFQIADGILGKNSGDKSWKWSLQKNNGSKGIRLNNTQNTTDGETFYIQSAVYLNDFASPNTFRMGGESYLGGARKTSYLEFASDGRVYQNSTTLTDDTVVIDKYAPGNWYTVTMAFYANEGKTNVYKCYLDGKEIAAYSYDGSGGAEEISNAYMINAWQFETAKASELVLEDIPFWAVLDDFKMVQGPFDPATGNMDLQSTEYTILNPTYAASGSQSASKISGIPAGVTVGEVKAKIQAPAGGSVRVVTVNPQTDPAAALLDGDDLTTVVLEDSAAVHGDCKVVSESASGAIKLYDLEIEAPQDYEATVTSNKYEVDSTAGTISEIPRGTSIARFFGEITASFGASAKLVNIADQEVSDGYVNNNLRLMVTSFDGVENVYTLFLDEGLIADYRGSKSYLDDVPLGLMQKLIGYEGQTIGEETFFGAGSSRYTRIAGFYGGIRSNFPSGDTSSELTYTKVTDQKGSPAYEFKNPTTYDVYRKLSDKTLAAYNANKGDDVIVRYSIQPMAAGRYVTAFDILGAKEGGAEEVLYPQNLTGRATPNLSFETNNGVNNIKFGVRENADGWCATIGTWIPGEKYDVVLALKKLDKNSDAFYVKGLWINGDEIEKTALGNGTISGEYWKLNNKDNGQVPYAPYTPASIAADENRNAHEGWTWNTAMFSAASADGITPGQVNYSGISIYTANGYVPEKDLALTSRTLEVYENDAILHRPTIKGFTGTAGDILAALSIPEDTVAGVYDGETLLPDSDAVTGGMRVRLYTKDCSVFKEYLLSDVIDMGKFQLFDSTGFIPVESITETDGGLVVQRTVRRYNPEDEAQFVLVAAVYEKDSGRLLSVECMDQKEYSEVDGLLLELDLSGYDTENILVKAMVFDSFNGIRPYCGSMILAETIRDDAPSPTNQQ